MISQNHAAQTLSGRGLARLLLFLVAALAFLLASFPARNSEVWLHLARGRQLAHGASPAAMEPDLAFDLWGNQTWLYDLLCYGGYSILGGSGLVLAKALLAAGIALFLVRLGRFDRSGSVCGELPVANASEASPGWCMPIICACLSLVAMGIYLPLQPTTVSYMFLALLLTFLRAATVRKRFFLLLVLFILWANVDRWFVLGLGVVALAWLGEVVDEVGTVGTSPKRWQTALLERGLAFVVLAAACLLNPSGRSAFVIAEEWTRWGSSARQTISPFESAYFAKIGWIAASLAYFLLLGASLLSFLAVLPQRRWQRFLPWLGLALGSALQTRVVPFFVILAGPVLACNVRDALARWRLRAKSGSDRGDASLTSSFKNSASGACERPGEANNRGVNTPRSPILETTVTLSARTEAALTVLLVLVLLVCAWPGWLGAPPFGPRRWAFDLPPSLERGAAVVRRWHEEGKLASDSGGLHLCPETVHAFAWFCPTEHRLRLSMQGTADQWRQRMRAAGITYVLVYDRDRERLSAVLGGLVVDAAQWPLLLEEGDLALFGWRDPARPGSADLFRGRQVDLNRLAFHPAEDKKAPPQAAEGQAERSWWDDFWKAAPLRSMDRDEALLHLLHAEALQRQAPQLHRKRWENSQAAGLLAAASAWAAPSALCDAQVRLVLFRPQLPPDDSPADRPSPLDQMAFVLQRRYTLQCDDAPPALYYLALRAARRAAAANPEDASAYLLLGESYLGLLNATRERAWGGQLRQLVQLRQAQASAALNRALVLRPDFLQAHLHLGRLYQQMHYLDRALPHLQTYCRLTRAAGPPRGVGRQEFLARQAHNEEELERLAREVQKREDAFTLASANAAPRERAFLAMQNGLAGKALELLLESHKSAFGNEGMELELELLLGVGRPQDVLQWLLPEHENDLGASAYHWFHARASAASGDYTRAEQECTEATRAGAPRPGSPQPVPLREQMALRIAHIVLDGQPSPQASLQIQSLAYLLRQQADWTVLRGLLALEEGQSAEAELAFRAALELWKDKAAAASGGGLDFSGRIIAQSCLRWLE